MGRGIIKEEDKKVRKVFIEDLPKKENSMDWISSVGYKVKGIYEGMEFEIKIVDYKEGYLYIKYLDKEPFKIWTTSFRNCNLGRLLDKRTDKFKIEIGTIFKDVYRDIIVTERKNIGSDKYYKYKCNKCGFDGGKHYNTKNEEYVAELWVIESSMLREKHGCSCCCSSPQIIVEGINDIPTTAPYLTSYFQGGVEEAKLYTASIGKKIIPICPDCGRVRDTSIVIANIFRSHSINCNCEDRISYPEKLMSSVLEQLQLDFISQLTTSTFKWCESYKYDFMVKESRDIIIETHGAQHYNESTNFKRTLKEEQENDRLKKELALSNGVKEYIVIDCRKSELDFIKQNILNSKLNELFDLNKIDWLKAEEFALSNLVKRACEYKKNNTSLTTTQIGEIMRLDRHTILDYLKKGSKLGWCSYSVENEMVLIKENRKNSCKKSLSKPISIFKDGIWLKGFDSIMECERQSEELFGVRLCNKNISAVLKGKRKHHRGFTFQYI